MKNIVKTNTSNNFLCYEMDGADYHTCPICGTGDFKGNDDRYDKLFNITNDMNYKEVEKIDDEINDIYFKNMKYCPSCHILFDLGYPYDVNREVYNGLLVNKWQYKDNIYYGMPQFDSIEDWHKLAKDVIILELVSPNNNIVFKKDSTIKALSRFRLS